MRLVIVIVLCVMSWHNENKIAAAILFSTAAFLYVYDNKQHVPDEDPV